MIIAFLQPFQVIESLKRICIINLGHIFVTVSHNTTMKNINFRQWACLSMYFAVNRRHDDISLNQSRSVSKNGCEWVSNPCPHQPETYTG